MKIKSVVIAAAVGCTILATSSLSAQTTQAQTSADEPTRWEIVVPSGTLLPTGAQRDAIKRGNMTALQLNYVATSGVRDHIHGRLGAQPRRRNIRRSEARRVHVRRRRRSARAELDRGQRGDLQPVRGSRRGRTELQLSQARRRRDAQLRRRTRSVGGELGVRRVRVRLEARDYVTGFKPLSAAAPRAPATMSS